LDSVVIEAFPSEVAEVDALRDGDVDYGYLPMSDYEGLKGYFTSHGYTISPWEPEYENWAEFDYSNPKYGVLFKQLYIRQALQHLVNQRLIIQHVLHGFGQYTYGPVPNEPGSPYVSPEEKTDPDAFSTTAAEALLSSHGWARTTHGGYLTCTRPGNTSSECGAGIRRGSSLAFTLFYTSSSVNLTEQVEYLVTVARKVGIDVEARPSSLGDQFSLGLCPTGPCNWGVNWYPGWISAYGDPGIYPTSGRLFGTGAPSAIFTGGYSSTYADTLIKRTHTVPGLEPLYTYEDYISRQVAALWVPTEDIQISVVKNSLRGWRPQQVFAIPEFSNWYFSG